MVKNLRESTLKDILDSIDDIGAMFNKGPNKNAMKPALSVSSISRASKDLVMSFPVLCDNSLDPRTATMICKAIERKAVTMLQLLFASCSFNGTNGREILAQWHNNMDTSSLSLDDYLDLCDRFSESCDSVKDKRMINEAVRLIRTEIRNGSKVYPTTSISESSINDYTVNNKYGRIVVSEAKGGKDKGKDKDDQGPTVPYTRTPEEIQAALKYVAANTDKVNAEKDSNLAKNAADITRINMSARKEKLQGDDYTTSFLNKQLLDTDVKKCNELVPSLMIVKFNSSEDGNMVTNQFVAGVKARLIPVDAYEIVDRVVSKNKDRAGLVNLIRATTSEISFVKDYLLAINKAKLDAKNNSIRNSSSRIWKTLEKRSTRSVWRRLTGKTNDAGCITTLVISQEIANLLNKQYNINLAKKKVADDIMDAYNLLALVIVDESTEVARFLFDGDDMFEDLSFGSLERESGDGSYKKVINLLSKMNRG